jgi:putative hydrolase of the HAD superfamily
LEVAPGECLFVDDTAGQVAAASEAGMSAHQFRAVEGLRAVLVAHGIDHRPDEP